MNLSIRSATGQPQCPICEEPVSRAGSFCTREHYQHFLTVVENQMVCSEVMLDYWEQDWYVDSKEV